MASASFSNPEKSNSAPAQEAPQAWHNLTSLDVLSSEQQAASSDWANRHLNPFAPEKGNVSWQQEAGHYALNFVKTASLFTPWRGRVGVATTIGAGLIHAASERNANGEWTAADGAFGFVKGVGMKAAVSYLGAKDWNFATKGIAFGSSNRLLDSALSTKTYVNKEGEVNVMNGLANSLSLAADPRYLVTDVAAFGIGHGVAKHVFNKGGDALMRSPIAANMVNGGAFGLSGGSIHEFQRQREMGEDLNIGKIAFRGVLQGTLDSFAAAPGGALMARQHRIDMAAERNLQDQARRSGVVEPSSVNVREFEVTGGKRAVNAALESFRQQQAEGQNAFITVQGREVLSNGKLGLARTLGIAHGEAPANKGAFDYLIQCNETGVLNGRTDLAFSGQSPVFMEAVGTGNRLRFTAGETAPSQNAFRLGLRDDVSVLNRGKDGRVETRESEDLDAGAGRRSNVQNVLTRKGERELGEAVRNAAEENPFVAALKTADRSTMWVGNEAKVMPLAPTAELMKSKAFKDGLVEELTVNDNLRHRLIKDLNNYRQESGDSPLPRKLSVEEQVKAIMEELPDQFVVKIARPEGGDYGDGGTRPFDAPHWKTVELEDGVLVIQERLRMGGSTAIEHLKGILGEKYEFVDPGMNDQVGYSYRDPNGRWPMLVDPTAVDRAGGADRTIMAFTRGQAEDDGYSGNGRKQQQREEEPERDGFRDFDPAAEIGQKGKLKEATKELQPWQQKLVEDLVASPETAKQAEQDAVITRWSELGFAPQAEAMAKQQVKSLMKIARQFRPDW